MAFGHWGRDNVAVYAHADKHVLIMASPTAVSALAQSAPTYRSVLSLVIETTFKSQDKEARQNNSAVPKLSENEDLLNLSDRVINAWRQHLGIKDESKAVLPTSP